MLLYEATVRIRPALVSLLRDYSNLPEEDALYITKKVSKRLKLSDR